MSAYVPSGPAVVLSVGSLLLVALLAGLAMQRLGSPMPARLLSWGLLVAGTAAVESICHKEPPGVRMLALIAFALLAMKSIVLSEERARGLAPLSFGRWLAFAAGWPGMQPRLFAGPREGALPGARALVVLGRAWTLFWLVAPLPLLFHGPFLAGVLWPLVGIPAAG